MKSLIRNVIILAVIAAILFIFCPSKQDHVDAIETNVLENIQTLAGTIGIQISEEDIKEKAGEDNRQLFNNLEMSNYYVCSVGRIDGNLASFGICGYVFTFPEALTSFLSGSFAGHTSL